MENITKGKGFAGFSGSDTPSERVRKEVIVAVTKPFKKIKGVKVTTEDTKFKKSKGKATKRVKQRVITVPLTVPKFRSATTGRYVTEKEGLETYLTIKNLINEILPEIVASKMHPPALEYQTGRFAEGDEKPQIVRISQTVGSPLASYTYQKYPYQTFEPGWKQGDPGRDPRRIIEESIREATTILALGRFNLRRV